MTTSEVRNKGPVLVVNKSGGPPFFISVSGNGPVGMAIWDTGDATVKWCQHLMYSADVREAFLSELDPVQLTH